MKAKTGDRVQLKDGRWMRDIHTSSLCGGNGAIYSGQDESSKPGDPHYGYALHFAYDEIVKVDKTYNREPLCHS